MKLLQTMLTASALILAGVAGAAEHHAAQALEHAEVHEHMTQGVKHLDEAIKHGKMGHADVASKHMAKAMTHIKASIGK